MDRDPFSFRPVSGDHQPRKPAGRKPKGFVQPRQVEDHWNLYRKGLYIAKPGRGWPAWLIPLVALILITGLVFWAAPAAINRIRLAMRAGDTTNESENSLLYGEDTWSVNKSVADVFDRDDLKAARLSQALYNEPARIISRDCTFGFVKVRLSDGLEGFMLLKDLTDSRDSIEPDRFAFKLVIAASSKRVMSHANKGTLLVEVVMGTVLFADYRGNGISRVKLPDGSIGWLSDDGVIVLPPLGDVSIPADGARYFCNTAMAFNQVTALENGLSIRGVSAAGIAWVAAAVNGITLPRYLAGMAESGEAVELVMDQDSGLPDPAYLLAGDLIFLADVLDPAKPGNMAICMGDGMVLYAGPGESAIQLLDLTQHAEILQKILLVRRIFAQ